VKYYHGGYGGLREGKLVLPPSITGALSCADYGAHNVCRRDRVYITTGVEEARYIASKTPGGKVYEVFPIGELADDPDCSEKGLSFECVKARVVRVVPKSLGITVYSIV